MSIASFSGLASGIQWRDMVDQIMQLEQQRQLVPVQSQVRLQQSRVSAWNSYQSNVSELASAVEKLRTGSAFGTFSTSVAPSATTGRALLSATASTTATPGSYQVEVLDLARAEKLGGSVRPDAAAALNLAGEFVVNGARIEIATGDSLNAVRDKINAANSGTAPTGVTATVLSTGTGSHRLVLTSDQTGAAGIELTDGSTGVLKELGFLSSSTSSNLATDGRSQTNRFSSTTMAIATALGVAVYPPPSTITVGGRSITVDLSQESLADIAGKIQSAGVAAETVSETVNGTTQYRLMASGAVSAGSADGERVLELLGFKEGGREALAQVVQTGTALTDGGGGTATAATSLTSLAGGVLAGDTFTIRGTRGDGTAVNLTYTVGATDTVQSVLDRLNSTEGFGGGSRPATISFVDGKFQATDSQTGDSQLSLSMVANNEGGGSLSFGLSQTQAVGRLRSMVAGSDAQMRVDGVLLSRSTNSVSDAISGVTLNLQQAEPGTQVALSVTRDQNATVEGVKAFVAAYNKVRSFVEAQNTGSGKPLDGSSALRASLRSMTDVILSGVTDPTSTSLTRLTLAGVSFSSTGVLELDESKLKEVLTTSPNDVATLFKDVGERMKTAAEGVTRTGDGLVASQTTLLNNSISTLSQRAIRIEDRLALRREGMLKRFIAMEAAMSQMQAQGSWMMSQVAALQPAQ